MSISYENLTKEQREKVDKIVILRRLELAGSPGSKEDKAEIKTLRETVAKELFTLIKG